MSKVIISGQKFTDTSGATRYFHGINIVDKGNFDGAHLKKRKNEGQWQPRTYAFPINATDLRMLRGLGLNIIRLGFTWEAIEPTRGCYNDEYIASIAKIMDDCHELGIEVLLDMHQDLYSGFGNGYGDGAPRWATITDGARYHHPVLVWAESYFISKAVAYAFDNFWRNTAVDGVGIQDSFASCWAHIASKLGDKPALFGYDLLNEPFGGSSGSKIFKKLIGKALRVVAVDRKFHRCRMIRGIFSKKHKALMFDVFSGDILRKITTPTSELMLDFDREFYNPFLERVSSAIRAVTDKGIITIDNNYFSNLGIPCGASRITVDGVDEPLQCFAPHGYDLMIDTNEYNYASDDRITVIFDEHTRTSERLNLPTLVGEWGGNCKVGKLWHEHIKYLYGYFTDKNWSEIYWSFNHLLYDDDNAYLFARAYAPRIHGTIIRQHYDYDALTYTLECDIAAEDTDNLVLYLPHKPQGLPYAERCVITPLHSSADIAEFARHNAALVDFVKAQPYYNKQPPIIHGAYANLDFENAAIATYSLPVGHYVIEIAFNHKN